MDGRARPAPATHPSRRARRAGAPPPLGNSDGARAGAGALRGRGRQGASRVGAPGQRSTQATPVRACARETEGGGLRCLGAWCGGGTSEGAREERTGGGEGRAHAGPDASPPPSKRAFAPVRRARDCGCRAASRAATVHAGGWGRAGLCGVSCVCVFDWCLWARAHRRARGRDLCVWLPDWRG